MAYIGAAPAPKMPELEDNTVETNDIKDGAVTAAKLAPGAAVPSQSGNSGKILKTDGTTASWAALADLSSWESKTVPTGDVVGTSDAQTLTNKIYTETVYNLTGTDITLANGSMQVKTLSGPVTLTESLANGQSVLLRLVNASTYAVTWFTITWVGSSGNVAPTLANDCHIVLWKSGSVTYGAFIGRSV